MGRPCEKIHPVPQPDTCVICRNYLRVPFLKAVLDGEIMAPNQMVSQTVQFKLLPPCRAKHLSVEFHPECKTCVRWREDEKFRAAWTEYLETLDNTAAVPCKHRGPVVPLPERRKYGLDTIKDWYPCKLGFGENGIVCPCTGCNPMCVGYELADDPSLVE